MAALTVTAPGWKRYSGQMSSVPPARSTRVGALDSMRIVVPARGLTCLFLRRPQRDYESASAILFFPEPAADSAQSNGGTALHTFPSRPPRSVLRSPPNAVCAPRD